MPAINPLSNPKSIKLNCELCGKVAYIQCQFCRVTYYCSKEHQTTDWNGIHVKICQLLVPLRTQAKLLGSEEERRNKEKDIRRNQKALLEMTRTEAQKHLHESNFELAIPAALQSLRFSMDLNGSSSIDLVPSYLLLGEASIGLNRYPQAEEYLSLAKYAVLKKPDCSHAMRSQLHRNFGKLYASLGKYDEALEQLAADIYYSSLAMGPEHEGTTGGYYHMGNVFVAQEQYESALAMYEKVVEIWYMTLNEAVRTLEDTNVELIDEAVTAESLQMLQRILKIREEHLGVIHTATAECHHILGLLYRYMRNYEKAREHTVKALELFTETAGLDHPSRQIVQQSLNYFDQFQEHNGYL
ncbi:hypothetical protein PROFUN_01933 [Planoprotostelium fungivorum]|uniref:MYND-type domain-containing protein n=1 Tax=Planoprotostelium fungivorum TaxID=1890364 RepID=A0A2P6NZ30_9EUKA|nr:hypothetical protein PROFUN_01933 [Planoprotostelium fungivorum]